MSNLSGFGSVVKSIQRGSLALDANPDTVTISSVVTTKSILFVNSNTEGDTTGKFQPRSVLTNATTLTFDQSTTGATKVAWQVLEYY